MSTVKELERQRGQVLEQMGSIRTMKRGSINKQYFAVMRRGKKTKGRRGPYYVFSRQEQGKTVSYRLKSQDEIQQARDDVAEYKRFKALCKQFEELTERLAALQRQQPDFEQEKKRRRSPSNKIRK
jgi:hypothetical protein